MQGSSLGVFDAEGARKTMADPILVTGGGGFIGSHLVHRLLELGKAEAYGEGFEDMERRQPDTAKINGLLGWEPEKNIDQIIDDVIPYFRTKG